MTTCPPVRLYSKAPSCDNDITVARQHERVVRGLGSFPGGYVDVADAGEQAGNRRDRGNLPSREFLLLARFVIDRAWAIVPAIGFELLADLHHFVNDPGIIFTGRSLWCTGAGVKGRRGFMEGTVAYLVENAALNLDRAAKLRDRECMRLQGIVVDDGGTSLG